VDSRSRNGSTLSILGTCYYHAIPDLHHGLLRRRGSYLLFVILIVGHLRLAEIEFFRQLGLPLVVKFRRNPYKTQTLGNR